MRQAVFTLVTASTFFDDIKEWSEPFFDAYQLGVRLNFDIDVKKTCSRRQEKHDAVTNVKAPSSHQSAFKGSIMRHAFLSGLWRNGYTMRCIPARVRDTPGVSSKASPTGWEDSWYVMQCVVARLFETCCKRPCICTSPTNPGCVWRWAGKSLRMFRGYDA